MLCAPSEHVGESMYPRAKAAGFYSSPTPPRFYNTKPSISQVREPPFLPTPKGVGFRAAVLVTLLQTTEVGPNVGDRLPGDLPLLPFTVDERKAALGNGSGVAKMD